MGNVDRLGLAAEENAQAAPPTAGQVLMASSADATRIVVGFLAGSALTYFVEQAFERVPAHLATDITLTTAGMLVGGALAGMQGRQLGGRLHHSRPAEWAGAMLGMMGGSVMSLVGFWHREQDAQGQPAPLNSLAIAILSVAGRSFVQQFFQLALGNLGPRIAPPANARTASLVTTTTAAGRALSGFFSRSLPAVVRRFAIAPALRRRSSAIQETRL